jgi:hypothetical protein
MENKEFSSLKTDKHCIECGSVITRKKLYTYTCSDECEKKNQEFFKMAYDRIESSLKATCKDCGKELRKSRESRVKYGKCEDCKKHSQFQKNKQVKDYTSSFLNKKKAKPISFQELNRRAEWKRLYDNESWLNRFKVKRM